MAAQTPHFNVKDLFAAKAAAAARKLSLIHI